MVTDESLTLQFSSLDYSYSTVYTQTMSNQPLSKDIAEFLEESRFVIIARSLLSVLNSFLVVLRFLTNYTTLLFPGKSTYDGALTKGLLRTYYSPLQCCYMDNVV